jgi:hypothetical protein
MIFAGDVVIKQAIELGIEDIRANTWLINDILSSFTSDPRMSTIYGQKEIDACKEWFLNNKIEINLRFRNDKEQFPCVSIALGSSSEMPDMKHMGDLSTEIVEFMPTDIGKTLPFIVKPFTHEGYDPNTGILSVPDSISLRKVVAGQVLVDAATGNGYVIVNVTDSQIELEAELDFTANQVAVIPKYQTYKARREHSFFQESYSIGCHVIGEPSQLLWLHAIVLYSLLRYREGLLEARCFTQSMVSSSDMTPNQNYGPMGAENVFSRYITLTGMVENSWLKTPVRTIESIDLVDRVGDTLKAGVKIISNLNSRDDLNTENDTWSTVDDEE